MKKISYFICVFFLLISCNYENGLNCFQSAGSIVERSIDVASFNRITVYERTQLIVSQGSQSVRVETGENLLNDIDVFTSGNELIIKNNNGCNLFRDYGITKVYVSAPEITEIRNSSGLTIESGNTLNYTELALISEDFEEEDGFHTDGDFRLDLNVGRLTIIQNNLSNFFLSGSVDTLDLNFTFGDARFEGRDLIVQTASIYHRGTNDIIINPQLEITGSLLSTGDVILVNTPPVIDLEELYTGRVIYED